MKKILFAIVFLFASIDCFANVQLVGTFVNVDGSPLNGTLRLQLVGKSVRDMCNGGRTISSSGVIMKIVNGVLQNGGNTFPTSDCTSPFSSFYVRVVDSTGKIILQDNWLLATTNFNLHQMDVGLLMAMSFMPQSPITVSVPNAVLSGPTLSQTVTQPVGTTFIINGNVSLGNATSDIKWNRPLIPVGGGSVAAMGTIGGSGPTSAAQNSWMRVQDSSGAIFWVPAWK